MYVLSFICCNNNRWIIWWSLHSLLHTTACTSATIITPARKAILSSSSPNKRWCIFITSCYLSYKILCIIVSEEQEGILINYTLDRDCFSQLSGRTSSTCTHHLGDQLHSLSWKQISALLAFFGSSFLVLT
jgi:hypothetical protein